METTIEKFEVRNRWTGAVQFTAEIIVTPDMLPSVKLGLAVKWARKNDADLSGAYLSGAYLRGADLRGAYLRGADLRDADLRDAYLRGADLRDAYLRGADLSGAYLRGADLRDADLRGAYLRDADLRDADLRDADLRDADLSGAYLRGAYLRGAYLRGAYLSGAYLSGADLRSVKADFFMILAMGHTEVPHLIKALREGRVDGSTYEGECACLVGTLENGGASGVPHQSDSPAEQWFWPIRKGTKPGDDSEGGFRSAKALEWALEYARLTGIELPADEVTA